MGRLEQVQARLTEFREYVREIVNVACTKALLAVGFTTDDSNFLLLPGEKGYKEQQTKYNMTYRQKSDKRRFCERLPW